jgi:hypothetical protein
MFFAFDCVFFVTFAVFVFCRYESCAFLSRISVENSVKSCGKDIEKSKGRIFAKKSLNRRMSKMRRRLHKKPKNAAVAGIIMNLTLCSQNNYTNNVI